MPAVRGDRVQLQQVVLNLLLNAFDAMKDSDGSDRTVLLNIGRIDERMLKVSVTDAGPGLPAGSVERVFDAFYTTKSNGLGMGLSISRSISKRIAAACGQRTILDAVPRFPSRFLHSLNLRQVTNRSSCGVGGYSSSLPGRSYWRSPQAVYVPPAKPTQLEVAVSTSSFKVLACANARPNTSCLVCGQRW